MEVRVMVLNPKTGGLKDLKVINDDLSNKMYNRDGSMTTALQQILQEGIEASIEGNVVQIVALK
jgi:hypothetical protein